MLRENSCLLERGRIKRLTLAGFFSSHTFYIVDNLFSALWLNSAGVTVTPVLPGLEQQSAEGSAKAV